MAQQQQQQQQLELTLFSDVPTTRGFHGRIQHGFRVYQLTFPQTTTSSERHFFFRTSEDGTRFAVSNQQWTALSFEQLFRQYNSGNEYAKTWKTSDYLCGVDTFTPEEIQSAISIWTSQTIQV